MAKTKSTKPVKTAPSGAGVKFTKKYDVKLASLYEADPDKLVIPPKGHFLYDPDGNDTFNETRVQSIDKLGKYVGAVTVYADKDSGTLYVIDGRGNTLDCREVNRRRRERGDDPIGITCTRFPGEQEEAQDFVAEKNFLRKRAGTAHTSREIARYHRLGRSWTRIAAILGLTEEVETFGPFETEEARAKKTEKLLRKRIPLAYCEPEVVVEIESKHLPLGAAKKFGGPKMDGSEALGRKEQLALLSDLMDAKSEKKAEKAASKGKSDTGAEEKKSRRWVPTVAKLLGGAARPGETAIDVTKRLIEENQAAEKVAVNTDREEIASRLANGQAAHLKQADLTIARAIAAYERFMAGDKTALDYLAPIRDIIVNATIRDQMASQLSVFLTGMTK